MRTLTLIAMLLFANVSLAQTVIYQSTTAIPYGTQSSGNSTQMEMLSMSNRWRTAAGLPAQQLSPELTNAAQDHANYMASTGDFQHYSNGGPQGRAARYGFSGGAMENIAMGMPTVESAFAVWRNSGGHWANITSSTTHAGFGYAVGRGGAAYWVGMYGNGVNSYQAPAYAASPAQPYAVVNGYSPAYTVASNPVVTTAASPAFVAGIQLAPGEKIVSQRVISERIISR